GVHGGGGAGAAPAVVDDVGDAGVQGVEVGVEQPRGLPGAGAVERLDGDDLRAGRHAHDAEAVVDGRDDTGDVGPMPVVILSAGGPGNKGGPREQVALQIGVGE